MGIFVNVRSRKELTKIGHQNTQGEKVIQDTRKLNPTSINNLDKNQTQTKSFNQDNETYQQACQYESTTDKNYAEQKETGLFLETNEEKYQFKITLDDGYEIEHGYSLVGKCSAR